MKIGLFILSIVALAVSAYALIIEIPRVSGISHLIYVALLFIVLCNCTLGIMITYSQIFGGRHKI